jgi:hypothetical protein
MKRIIFLLITFISLGGLVKAQVADHAIGLRFGSGDGLGTEISYQHGLGSFNRLELDLGFSSNHAANNYYNSWSFTGLYHWVWKLDKQLYWYVGPGGKMGGWNYDQNNSSYNNGFYLSAAGDLGIEYVFPVGIQLALNARPEIGLINHGTGINVGFAVRYQF